MIYGEFNAFAREEAENILRKMYKALKPGGQIVIEATTVNVIIGMDKAGPSWYAAEAGFFPTHPISY